MSARFITFEGIDGAGKTTHMDTVERRLGRGGQAVVRTREPGGTALAEKIRALMLTEAMGSLTEALLAFAARRDHIECVIQPALARGDTVLCDRFTDATFAYQGGGRGVDLSRLESLESWVQGDLQPDLTLWFDVDPEIAAKRRAAARSPDRFEQLDLAFFRRVREAYLQRATAAPGRFVRIDSGASQSEVARQVEQALERRQW
jgi:dTMP kinase